MISIESKGSFHNTEAFLLRMSDAKIFSVLDEYGRRGVEALSTATPTSTGETAHSWHYRISHGKHSWAINFHNSHMAGQVPLAILIQLGHATGTGGYVQGRDFINPAIKTIFDELAADVWKKVTSK